MKQKQTTPAEETEDKRPDETPDEESSDGESPDEESSDGLKEAGESMLSHLMALRKVLHYLKNGWIFFSIFIIFSP